MLTDDADDELRGQRGALAALPHDVEHILFGKIAAEQGAVGRHPEDDAGKPPDIRTVLRDEQQLLSGQGQAAEFGLLLGVAQAHVEIRLGEFRPEAGFEARKQRLAEAPFLGAPHARHDDGFALIHEAIQQETELLAHGRPGGLLRLGDQSGRGTGTPWWASCREYGSGAGNHR